MRGFLKGWIHESQYTETKPSVTLGGDHLELEPPGSTTWSWNQEGEDAWCLAPIVINQCSSPLSIFTHGKHLCYLQSHSKYHLPYHLLWRVFPYLFRPSWFLFHRVPMAYHGTTLFHMVLCYFGCFISVSPIRILALVSRNDSFSCTIQCLPHGRYP